MKNHIQIILLTFGFLVSCNQIPDINYGNAIQSMPFDFDNDINNSDIFFELIDSVRFIQLETTEECIISAMSKIMFDNEYFYILENETGLLKFDMAGNFKLKISKIGRGPGESGRPSDFAIYDDIIIILDELSSKILFYTKEGEFLREHKTGIPAQRFGITDDGNLGMMIHFDNLFHTNRISIIDMKGNVIKKHLPARKSIIDKSGLSMLKPFHNYNGDLLFTDIFNNRVFQITTDSVMVKYFFDFGKYTINEQFLYKNKNLATGALVQSLIKNGLVGFIDFFNETDLYLYFTCIKDGNSYTVIFDKNYQIPYIFENKMFPEWFRLINTPFMHSANNLFITVILPLTYNHFEEKHIHEIMVNPLFSELNTVLNNAEISDNPILLLYYFKQ